MSQPEDSVEAPYVTMHETVFATFPGLWHEFSWFLRKVPSLNGSQTPSSPGDRAATPVLFRRLSSAASLSVTGLGTITSFVFQTVVHIFHTFAALLESVVIASRYLVAVAYCLSILQVS
jgi:hypothetical protein